MPNVDTIKATEGAIQRLNEDYQAPTTGIRAIDSEMEDPQLSQIDPTSSGLLGIEDPGLYQSHGQGDDRTPTGPERFIPAGINPNDPRLDGDATPDRVDPLNPKSGRFIGPIDPNNANNAGTTILGPGQVGEEDDSELNQIGDGEVPQAESS